MHGALRGLDEHANGAGDGTLVERLPGMLARWAVGRSDRSAVAAGQAGALLDRFKAGCADPQGRRDAPTTEPASLGRRSDRRRTVESPETRLNRALTRLLPFSGVSWLDPFERRRPNSDQDSRPSTAEDHTAPIAGRASVNDRFGYTRAEPRCCTPAVRVSQRRAPGNTRLGRSQPRSSPRGLSVTTW